MCCLYPSQRASGEILDGFDRTLRQDDPLSRAGHYRRGRHARAARSLPPDYGSDYRALGGRTVQEIRLAKTAGFCFGVNRAVSMVYAMLEEGKTVYTLGPIIHNPQVVTDLEKRGVVIVDETGEVPQGGCARGAHARRAGSRHSGHQGAGARLLRRDLPVCIQNPSDRGKAVGGRRYRFDCGGSRTPGGAGHPRPLSG